MKSAIIVTLIIILIGYTNTALSQNSTSEPNAQFPVDAYKQISSGMTRTEVRNRLGDPAAIRAKIMRDILVQGVLDIIEDGTE